jgi:type IV pilus assembly protein PilB
VRLNVARVRADDQIMMEAAALRLLASEYNLEFVDLERYKVDEHAAALLPADVARACHAVPLGRKFGTPVVAIADPRDSAAVEALRAAMARDFVTVVAPEEQIEAHLERLYSANGDARSRLPGGSDMAGPSGPGGPPGTGEELAPEARGQATTLLDRALGEIATHVAAFPGVAVGDAPSSPGANLTAGQQTPLAPPPSPAAGPTLGEPPVAGAGAPGALRTGALAHLAADAPSEVHGEAPDTGGAGGPAGVALAPRATSGPVDSGLAARISEALDEALRETAVASGKEVEQLAELVDEAVTEFEQSSGSAVAAPGSGLSDLPPLARVLVEGGRIDEDVMREVVAEQLATGESLAKLLASKGLASEADLMWGMAKEMGLEFIDLDRFPVDYTHASKVPEHFAERHNFLVIGRDDDETYVVAMSNPTNVYALDDLRTVLGRKVRIVVAARSQIAAHIRQAYHGGGDPTSAAERASAGMGAPAGALPDEEITDLASERALAEDAPIIRYVNLLILQALNERASDIHIEPTAEHLRIRFRIDGVLHDISTAPRNIAPAVTTRVKVMADMDIAEHRLPQDGRVSLSVGPRQIDLRVSTLPTIYGEKVVMRVLDKSAVLLELHELGMEEDLLKRYRDVYTRPYGTILVTGPTGSGKTTTLYGTLAAINSPEKNIVTVEDPVELKIKGINQIQLNQKAGLTFASALRSILRSDPDVVLVGEIRDRETAVISVEAALTGHLVLATLHTNDAASTPMRLVEMGLEPYLVTSAITAVVAQRLVRVLCPNCKEPYDATEAAIAATGWDPEEVFAEVGEHAVLYRAGKCPACANTGYHGRRGLFELLVISEEIERAIIEGASADEIHRLAVAEGMRTLREAGLRRALDGTTSLEEVLRVVA